MDASDQILVVRRVCPAVIQANESNGLDQSNDFNFRVQAFVKENTQNEGLAIRKGNLD